MRAFAQLPKIDKIVSGLAIGSRIFLEADRGLLGLARSEGQSESRSEIAVCAGLRKKFRGLEPVPRTASRDFGPFEGLAPLFTQI